VDSHTQSAGVGGGGEESTPVPRSRLVVRKNFNFPGPVDAQLKAAAQDEYRSEVQVVIRALELYFRERRRQHAEDKQLSAQS
jgi:hypothetical protein